MTLLLFLTGLTTHASTVTPPPSVSTLEFGVSGPTVQAIFPISMVNSSYAAITFPTNLTLSSASGLVSTGISVAGQSGPSMPLDFAQATNAGTYIGAIVVTFTGASSYAGIITISGTDAAKFSLSPSSDVLSVAYPCNLYVAQTDIAAGSYSFSLTANP